MIEFLKQPWPWYLAGPIMGLIVPALLIAGNKLFGISSTLRQICAICLPANIPYFKYDWKQKAWNLFFVAGIVLGGFIATHFLNGQHHVNINPATTALLKTEGIKDFKGLIPTDVFSFEKLLSLKGLIFIVLGGFFVGFGTRYAGGCTSGHSIMGIASLQWPSLLATICFMIGGFISTWFILPYLISL